MVIVYYGFDVGNQFAFVRSHTYLQNSVLLSFQDGEYHLFWLHRILLASQNVFRLELSDDFAQFEVVNDRVLIRNYVRFIDYVK